MIFKKGTYTHKVGHEIILEYDNSESTQERTFVFSFEDLKEPLFLSSSNLKPDLSFVGRISVLNENNKAVVLLDSVGSVGSLSTLAPVGQTLLSVVSEPPFLSTDGFFLLTPKTKILVEVTKVLPESIHPKVVIPYAFWGVTPVISKNGYFNAYTAFPAYMKRKFISLDRKQKLVLSAREFDALFVSIKSNSQPSGVKVLVNDVEFDISQFPINNFLSPLKDSSFYQIENISDYDLSFLLIKKVYNTETFLAYQYLLDLRILDLSILLRNDFHNIMSRVYFGELPDIERLKTERELLLHSDFNEANKGYYDDYDVQGVIDLDTNSSSLVS